MGKLKEFSKDKAEKEFLSINSMRDKLGMPLLEKGFVKCILGCGETFYSYDVKGNRMCFDCKAKQTTQVSMDYSGVYNVSIED